MNGIEDDDDPLESVEESLARKMEYTAQLKAAILRLHGCESDYAGREEVIETLQGETVWTGYVEIFWLIGHPKAKRCYAWSHLTGENDKDRRFVAVLELPPVNSPETAVQAAVVAEIKDARENTKGRPRLPKGKVKWIERPRIKSRQVGSERLIYLVGTSTPKRSARPCSASSLFH